MYSVLLTGILHISSSLPSSFIIPVTRRVGFSESMYAEGSVSDPQEAFPTPIRLSVRMSVCPSLRVNAEVSETNAH